MIDLALIYYSLFIGVFIFTFAKALSQTRAIWKYIHSLHNAYLYMVWIEIWVNFVFTLITFLFLNSIIQGSLSFLLASVILWSIQTQLLPQIIANRGLAIIITPINIAVSYIWTTAHLGGATPTQQHVNVVFEKAEKAFFLVIDLSLNLYFLYLVRSSLIANSLDKYWRLFNFNAGMVFISTSMDILLLGFLSLPDPYLYIQFSPLAYIVKLYIELLIASLISKVARGSWCNQGEAWYSNS
ncbi:hypothetical protein V2G26_007420 [Clonostachys chloroleuca]